VEGGGGGGGELEEFGHGKTVKRKLRGK